MSPARPDAEGAGGPLLRLAAPELDDLLRLVLRRAPGAEWATFARFGWRETARGLVLTLAALDPPEPGDLDEGIRDIKIAAPYLRRIALAAESHPLAVGLVHSHPDEAAPRPSALDDEMDAYLAAYVADFAPGRPFASLILSRVEGEIALSGRVFLNGSWHGIERVSAERRPDIRAWPGGERPAPAPMPPERVARLTSAFGREAYQRLQRSTVALIGAGGTGSAAIPILARAGVGRLIVVDADHASESNLERLHGSTPGDAADAVPKVAIARRHVASMAPDVTVEAWFGRLPQPEILDAVLQADVLMGCTDQHSSRLAVADVAARYALPAIDCGGLIEGRDGVVTGQIIQLVRFLAADPCPACRGMISTVRLRQELLSPEERLTAAQQAAEAIARGERPDPIATAIPQIDTVGYITTTAGTLAAGYVVGWLTGRFDPRFERLQLDLVAESLGAVDRPQRWRPDCACGRVRGQADQAIDPPPVQPPPHWPEPRRLA
ncbi:ThiF family adenylyltransferase [Salinarimonas soli]|uniref:ThiF family adenylyltransferase n=1 Tax=Salinarimonas soli TaxID=1638099 RepID=A0A5B2W0V1_9HYPH|nr:ThiF family adenylyltransferase [Salinarimonas soli]KAA2244262.1 ThiF family adenylyltransferase [Salinarimonas soli]